MSEHEVEFQNFVVTHTYAEQTIVLASAMFHTTLHTLLLLKTGDINFKQAQNWQQKQEWASADQEWSRRRV